MTQVVALDGDENGLLSLLAGIEAQSEHHIAAAIRRAAAARGIEGAEIAEVTTRAGKGIIGRDASGTIWAGNPYLAGEMGADLRRPELAPLDSGAQTVVYLGRGSQVLGAAAVADEARASAASALAALRDGGVKRIVMMTGDRRPVALRIGLELGLAPNEIGADMLPENKVQAVAALARRLRRRRSERCRRAGPPRCRHRHGRRGIGRGASGGRRGPSIGGSGAACRGPPPVAAHGQGHPPEPELCD